MEKVKKEEKLENGTYMSVEEVAELVSVHITELSEKIRQGRIKDPKKEELRIKQIRALSTLCKTYAALVTDIKVEDLEKKMEIFEKEISWRKENDQIHK